jgi:hypothetical protein
VLASLLNRHPARRPTEPVLLARSLEQTVDEAWRRSYSAWSATTPLHDARARRCVRDATPELSSLARALREHAGSDPEALQLCRGLIGDGFASPLYGGNAEALRREAGRLRFRLLAGAVDG